MAKVGRYGTGETGMRNVEMERRGQRLPSVGHWGALKLQIQRAAVDGEGGFFYGFA